jgi:hypothetical protein
VSPVREAGFTSKWIGFLNIGRLRGSNNRSLGLKAVNSTPSPELPPNRPQEEARQRETQQSLSDRKNASPGI